MPQTTSLIYHRPISLAETGEEVYNRVVKVLEEIEQSSYQNIIIVGHGVSIQMFVAQFSKLPINILESMALNGSSGGVSFLSEREDGMRILN